MQNFSYLNKFSQCIQSRGNAIHRILHSATRMKKTTNLAKMSTQFVDQFWDLDDMFLRIRRLDTAVELAASVIFCLSVQMSFQ